LQAAHFALSRMRAAGSRFGFAQDGQGTIMATSGKGKVRLLFRTSRWARGRPP